jgi:ubiquinone/menaquinone biosynthesis C-methylase UbiE
MATKRDFDTAAKTWDQDEARLRLSNGIADAMISVLALTGSEVLLDYGTGTGTVALRFQPLVRQVIAADSSLGMLSVLEDKIRAQGLNNVRAMHLDLERDVLEASAVSPNVVVSAMALHHIADTERFAEKLFSLICPGGKLAIADLDTEAGDFHADNTGVEHFGFDRDRLSEVFSRAGFSSVRFDTAYTFQRPTKNGEKSFSIFLLSAARA